MQKLTKAVLSLLLLSLLAMPQASEAHGGRFKATCAPVCGNLSVVDMSKPLHKEFCSVHNRTGCLCLNKIKLGECFNQFDMEDQNNNRWISSHMKGKPVVILAGHRSIRWEIAKWAECFNKELRQTGKAHVVWVNDLSRSRFHTIRDEQYSMWRAFKPAVPVLFDWDGVVGRSLKIDYDKPNIIVLDPHGRLVMHEMKNFDWCLYASISGCIKNLCNTPVSCECAPACAPYITMSCAPSGCKCDSY